MNLKELQKDIESAALKPVYLFYGAETLLKEKYIKSITELVSPDMADFNLEVLLADDTEAPKVIESAQSFPFLNPPRIIIVKGVDRYPKEDLSLLREYIDNPNDTACLVLSADEPDMRLGLFKNLKAKNWAVNFAPPKGRGLTQWVSQAAAERDVRISSAAVNALIELVGNDLSALNQELEKVCLFVGPDKPVEVTDVKAVARHSKIATIFELGDAVGEQNPARAIAALKTLSLFEPSIRTLFMITRHFRLLFKAGSMMQGHLSMGDIRKDLGVPPFAAEKYIKQARNLGLDLIKKGMHRLIKADVALKSSNAPDSLIMEKLVLDLALLRARR